MLSRTELSWITFSKIIQDVSFLRPNARFCRRCVVVVVVIFVGIVVVKRNVNFWRPFESTQQCNESFFCIFYKVQLSNCDIARVSKKDANDTRLYRVILRLQDLGSNWLLTCLNPKVRPGIRTHFRCSTVCCSTSQCPYEGRFVWPILRLFQPIWTTGRTANVLDFLLFVLECTDTKHFCIGRISVFSRPPYDWGEKPIWQDLESNPGFLIPQASPLTTRPWLLRFSLSILFSILIGKNLILISVRICSKQRHVFEHKVHSSEICKTCKICQNEFEQRTADWIVRMDLTFESFGQ